MMRNALRKVLFGSVLLYSAAEAGADPFLMTKLVSDTPGAQVTDPNLVNPWGMSFSGAGPFWISNNATGTSTLYSVTASTNVATKIGLTVTIPGNGTVTGQVFNTSAAAGAFNKDNFLFVSEDGTVSGWRGALGTAAETLFSGSAANVYKGSALDEIGGHAYLLGANFRAGTIDVFKGDGTAPALAGAFTDPNAIAGYAPFNVQTIGSTVYVTYAKQDAAKHDDVSGAGNGFVDAYDLNGNLLRRVTTGGLLNSPWGLAIAPSSFGAFAGKLLVGNFGDGRISAFDPLTGALAGQLTDLTGNALSIDGLWAIAPGNGGSAGSSQKLFFTAGPNGEANGLFGSLAAVPEPSPLILGGLTVLVGLAVRKGRRLLATSASL